MEALRYYILQYNVNITEAWKYKVPFYLWKGKMFCYLWIDKKNGFPYVGLVKGGLMQHPALEQGNRKQMKVLPIDPTLDIPESVLIEVLDEAIQFYP